MAEFDLMFTAWGTPGPKGSKTPTGKYRATKSGGVTPILRESSKVATVFEERVAWYATLAIKKMKEDERAKFPMEGPLVATMVFTVKRNTRGPNSADAPSVYPDVSKYARAAEDACNGIVWTDDGRVIGYDLLWKTYPGRHPYALEKPGLMLAVRRATHVELGLSASSMQGEKYTLLKEKWDAGDRD